MSAITMDRVGDGSRNLVAVVAVLAICAVSMLIQWRFGYSWGRTSAAGEIWGGWTEAHLYGAAAVAGDALKALLPLIFMAAFFSGYWLKGLVGAVLWTATVACAVMGALGHIAVNRFDTIDTRAHASASYQDVRAEMKRASESMSWVPAHRPIDTVSAELNVHKAQRFWLVTDQCTDVKGKSAREYCQQFHKMEAELASGIEAGKIQARIDAASVKIATSFKTGAPSEADPQAGVIARITGKDIGTVQGFLVFLIAFLIEGVAGFGLYAVCGVKKPARVAANDNEAVEPEETDNVVPLPVQSGVMLPAGPAIAAAAKSSGSSPATPAKSKAIARKSGTGTPAHDEVEPVPYKSYWKKQQAYKDLFNIVVAKAGTVPSLKVLAKRYQRPKNTITRWMDDWDRGGMFQRVKNGAFKQVRAARQGGEGAISAAA